jgi:hypothetical protein
LIPDHHPAITVLEGLDRINTALDVAAAAVRTEILTIQPGGARKEKSLAESLERGHPAMARNVRMRTLYQHTIRHSYGVYAYAERLAGLCDIRTLEECPDRLMIFDRTVAFVRTAPVPSTALQLRDPHLITFLAEVFEHFWQQAVPLHEPLPDDPAPGGISAIRRSIARLLVEGLVDEAIAHRLGLHVRTCRAHIAKLSAVLGSTNRAQLGYLIVKSGIVDK